LIACALEKISLASLRLNAGLLTLIGIASLVFTPKIAGIAKAPYELPFYEAMIPWAYAAAAIALVGGLAGFVLAKRQKDWAILAIAIGGYLGGQVVFIGHDQWGKYSAGVYHLPAIQAELKADTPIFAVGRYEQSLPFYLRRTTILVEHPDEMEFGVGIQPELWIPKRADFFTKWRTMHAKGEKAVAFLNPSVYKAMQDEAVPMKVIGEDPKRIIVAIP